MSVFRRRIIASRKESAPQWELVTSGEALNVTIDGATTTTTKNINLDGQGQKHFVNGETYKYEFDYTLIATTIPNNASSTAGSIRAGSGAPTLLAKAVLSARDDNIGVTKHYESEYERSGSTKNDNIFQLRVGASYSYTISFTNVKVWHYIGT